MGDSPSPPAVPNPYAVANAQSQANVQSGLANSILSNPNVTNPYGSVTYTPGATTSVGGQNIPRYNENVTLSPGQQKLYDQQTALGQQENTIAGTALTNVGGILSTPVNQAPNLQTSFGPTDFSQNINQTTQAIQDRLAPQLAIEKQQLQSQLASQGVTPGSQAYETAMDEFGRQENDSNQQALLAGLQEQNTLFGQSQAQAAFGNSAQLQQMQAQQALRDAPINEVSTLMHGGQVTAPQFAAYQAGQIAPAPVASSVYQSAGLLNNQYTTQLQADAAQNAGLYGALGSVAGAAGARIPSDRRLKRDIVETGTIGRFKAYAFRYLWDRQIYIGVMAGEVLAVMPDAVAVNDDGFMLVDYAKLVA